jgi:hypothetical protein
VKLLYTAHVSTSALLGVALFVLLLAGLSLLRRRAVSSQSVNLLRSLFPSWRFFEVPEGQLLLLARAVSEQSTDAPFGAAIPPARRNLATPLFSPHGNLQLACHDLVDALVQELAEQPGIRLEQAEQLVSYRLVQNLVQWQMRERGDAPSAYQLKLVSQGVDGQEQELFVSPVYPCS